MNNRRDFLKGSAIAASALVLNKVLPVQASETTFAGIIYTKENPGKWGRKVGSHLPLITIKGNQVTLATKHPMSAKHYIVRHTLVLNNGTVVGAKTFSPDTKKAISTYKLPAGYKGTVYATSFCNLHDFWLNKATV